MSAVEASQSVTSTSAEPIIAVSSDGRQFPMDLKMIAQSATLNKLVLNFGYDKDATKREPIPVENVNGDTMEKVIEWLDHYKNEPVYVEPSDKNHLPSIMFTEWDRRFMRSMSSDDLFDMINAANFLCIARLYDATSKKVANMISGKTAEQIRDIFNIAADDESDEEAVVESSTGSQMETDSST